MDFNVKETAGDRIVILSRPLTLPGCCAICGYTGTNVGAGGDIRVFIDFQLDIDYYGRIYWCSTCLLQAANALSWLSVDQAESLLKRVSLLEGELIVLREQNERLRASLTSLLGQSADTVGDILVISSENVEQGSLDFEGGSNPLTPEQFAPNQFISKPESVGVSSDSGYSNDSGEFTL